MTLHATSAGQDGSLDRLDGLDVEPTMLFVDAGYSSGTLIRPARQAARAQPAAGAIDRLYVLSPHRLSRKIAYQVLLDEEFTVYGPEVVLLNNPIGSDPEETLLLQVQGMISEYERAKILERNRRDAASRPPRLGQFAGRCVLRHLWMPQWPSSHGMFCSGLRGSRRSGSSIRLNCPSARKLASDSGHPSAGADLSPGVY